MIDECFYNPTRCQPISSIYLDEALRSNYHSYDNQSPYLDDEQRRPESLHAPTSFINSTLCKDLAQHFCTDVSESTGIGYADSISASFLKILPYHGIDWHYDISRNCAINILLNDVKNCVTLFRYKNKDRRVLQENWALEYELFRPVLLNTTVEHMVANWSSESRYIITVGFPKHISFSQVRNFLQSYVPSE